MLSFLNRTDELDWRMDPDYLAAVTALSAARDAKNRTETERIRLWGETNIQGCNPPVNSPYWPVEAAATVAAQAHAEATAAHDHAEARAKAAVRPTVIDDYRDRASRIFAIEDQLIDELTELEARRNSARARASRACRGSPQARCPSTTCNTTKPRAADWSSRSLREGC